MLGFLCMFFLWAKLPLFVDFYFAGEMIFILKLYSGRVELNFKLAVILI